MKNSFFLGVGCIIAAVAVVLLANQKTSVPRPDHLDFRTIPEIRRIRIPNAESEKLQAFYLAFADIVERDAGQKIVTWNDFREVNIAAGNACFGDEFRGGYRELGEAIDTAIRDVKKDNTVDYKVLSTLLREIAYSF